MKLRALILWVLTAVATLPAAAAELTPELYVVIDLQVREATLVGMQERRELLSRTHNPQMAESVERRSRERVAEVYRYYGVSPARHAAYATYHREAIERWQADNPDVASQYQDLERRFDTLSRALSAQGSQP